MEYYKDKFPACYQWIDANARNSFCRGTGIGSLKSLVGFNHYGQRNKEGNQSVSKLSILLMWELENIDEHYYLLKH